MSCLRRLHASLISLCAMRPVRVVIAGIALTLVAACATAPRDQGVDAYAGKSIEEQVKERASKRWEALIRGDLDVAYGYFSKATRDTYPFDVYRVKMRPGMWREARIDSVRCADGICDVAVTVTMDHSRLKGIVTPVTERWIVQDGVAWYVYNG